MKAPLKKKKLELDKRFQKVSQTPASFAFFVAVHDFVDHIEREPILATSLTKRSKLNQEADLTTKYAYLKQIHQGLKDIKMQSANDLGHDRYMAIRDLGRIQKGDMSENNSFWKKRETTRNVAGEIYERLTLHLLKA